VEPDSSVPEIAIQDPLIYAVTVPVDDLFTLIIGPPSVGLRTPADTAVFGGVDGWLVRVESIGLFVGEGSDSVREGW
jgi:hypothetical protein